MTRFKRMRGYKALWVPGADHAGFETQIVYEKKLEKEGRSRFKIDPKELYKEILNFTLENKKYMEDEVRAMGASCDWSREKFTLDPDVIYAVHKTFKRMYDDNLVYRGKRAVNWCTKHQTSLSDVETESKELNDTLYYIKYGPITVATVRPETIFGDVAIAVHPEDVRYKQYIGKMISVDIPGSKLELKVIADEKVDREFGTGALKITPAHDKNDFEFSERHHLPIVEVIDQFGKLNDKTGPYKGLKVLEARRKVAEDLEKTYLIEKKEPYVHTVPVCYKCETIIEPRIIPQWFVKMKPLADLALEAVRRDKIVFYPDHQKKVFEHWMENPIDWNISRQIVWGIRIPAKICDSCGFGEPDLENALSKCPRCGSKYRADTDTFDTWFSSGQWPLITLGFPDGKDFKEFYPTDIMETGYDLVFKWVPRMVIFGLYLAKKVPFHNVYLHGLVNDAQGKKMSKSKGNVVSPLTLTDEFGTDALRMALVVGNTPGTDLSLSPNKVKGYKHFANKMWNAARFVLSHVSKEP
ncbi:valine--tRNA ligase, partial [Candidatus Parcubacteria bacterium]|nr:valine--tRNA ligase [Candidatus Parcubacteria bacterium]